MTIRAATHINAMVVVIVKTVIVVALILSSVCNFFPISDTQVSLLACLFRNKKIRAYNSSFKSL